MKILMFTIYFSCLFNSNFPPEDIAQISNVVQAFSKNVDHRNVGKLNKILHDDFRAIVNQAFGSEEVQLMDKQTYLDLVNKKVIGGDDRSIIILSVDVEENNAIVKAKFTGKELVFTTFIQVIKDETGDWKIMSDLPAVKRA